MTLKKKYYMTPEAEIEKFILQSSSLITTSEGGINDGDTGEEVGDDF